MTSPPVPERWNLTDDIPRRMPVLGQWLARVARAKPLRGVTVLLIQHQLGNHAAQAAGLLRLGVRPQDLHWIDIPYTSTPAVRAVVRRMRVPARNFVTSEAYDVLEPYAPYQRNRVAAFLRRLVADPPERLVVLDDGAYMLEAVASVGARPPHLAIVEQTTRGLIKIENDPALAAVARQVPIVNVARSAPKMRLEPVFIGHSVCDALERHPVVARGRAKDARCLVLGYGAIGRQVAAFVRGRLGFPATSVHVHDEIGDRVTEAEEHGFTPWDRGDLGVRFDLVVGCSGRASFRVGDHAFLRDGALLASASSGSVELSREDFIELANRLPDDEVEILPDASGTRGLHSDLVFRFGDRTATWANAGWPVNFSGRVNCIPAHYIQPTQTMMCAAAVQAARTTRTGVVELDPEFCARLEADFRGVLGAEAARLLPG